MLHSLRETRINLSRDIVQQREDLQQKWNKLRDWKQQTEIRFQNDLRQKTVEMNNLILELRNRKDEMLLQWQREQQQKDEEVKRLATELKQKNELLAKKLNEMESLSAELSRLQKLLMEDKTKPIEELLVPETSKVESNLEEITTNTWLNEIPSIQVGGISHLALTPTSCLVSHFVRSRGLLLSALLDLTVMSDCLLLDAINSLTSPREIDKLSQIAKNLINVFSQKYYKSALETFIQSWCFKQVNLTAASLSDQNCTILTILRL
eukprot:TRINITY_DN11746_c0_g1_i1.p1 TRINITY_DN11746_c0_g1~~TRINITY_DN11746_c0_g1_i1.p1  ORF type:complete len:265 (-),score=56.23 TRINITY_DN11746_c0_g1_i1:133-927(-)